MTNPALDFRPRWHIAPPTGRLNDPNGLFLSSDRLHVFYQHDPVFPFASKRTGWGHVVLTRDEPPRHFPDALHPGRPADRDGCYSGCAVRDDLGGVRLFYTGNRKDGARRTPSVNQVVVHGADRATGGSYLHHPGNPLIGDAPSGYTGHVRDPYITRLPAGEWLMLLGARRADRTATLIAYLSEDLDSWRFVGELGFDTAGATPGAAGGCLPGGFMWECPNLVTLTDRADGEDYQVLVCCPQGLREQTCTVPGHPEARVRYFASSDQCGYLVGRLRIAADGHPHFQVTQGFRELDWGHEFYAPQLIETGQGGALIVGWLGLPGADLAPSLAAGWAHTLTVPRSVELRAGRLVQRPVLGDARGSLGVSATEPADQQRVRVRCAPDRDAQLELRDTAGVAAVRVRWRAAPRTLSVTRNAIASPAGAARAWRDAGLIDPALVIRLTPAESAGRSTAPPADPAPAGDTRTFPCPPGGLDLLVDACAIEVFAGDGAATASLEAWPSPGASWLPVRAA